MNKIFFILLSVLLSSEFIKSTPRYGYRFWSKFVGSSEESSEDDSYESCVNCSQTNIGNGNKNVNIIRHNTYPKYDQNIGQTDMYQEIEEQRDNESQFVTKNTYGTTPKQAYKNFRGNKLQGGDENYNTQRPFRYYSKNIHENRRLTNEYNQKRTSVIGDFGNGHHNTKTFNIYKKDI